MSQPELDQFLQQQKNIRNAVIAAAGQQSPVEDATEKVSNLGLPGVPSLGSPEGNTALQPPAAESTGES